MPFLFSTIFAVQQSGAERTIFSRLSLRTVVRQSYFVLPSRSASLSRSLPIAHDGPVTSGMPGWFLPSSLTYLFFFRLLLIKIKEKSIHAHYRREANTRSIISDIIVFFFSRVLWVVFCVFFTFKNDILIFSYTSLSTIFLWLSSFDSSGF